MRRFRNAEMFPCRMRTSVTCCRRVCRTMRLFFCGTIKGWHRRFKCNTRWSMSMGAYFLCFLPAKTWS
uniref:Uncharacterized protein n=1 Tax=Rhizophora mucronata TaxID=61149 RepID=A0A2P2IQA0_RHIMU